MGIKLIVGLGNPGRQYGETRHNAGFWFLDELAARYGVEWSADTKFQGHLAAVAVAGVKVLLLKPQTFMNRSGQSVGAVLRYYKFEPEHILVVHDELDLSVGVVRIKKGGGHAGHNGLRDIVAHLGNNNFYRLRVGIDRPPSAQAVVDYVLSAPSRQEKEMILSVFENVYKDMDLLISGEFERLMNRLH